jgi:hypothetical protein
MEEYNANNMGDIRRLILTNSGSGGVEFPISLIEGDNGVIGVKLFEYIIENVGNDLFSFYEFKDNEDVYVQGVKIDTAVNVSDDMIALESPDKPGNILVIYLLNTGVLTIVWD